MLLDLNPFEMAPAGGLMIVFEKSCGGRTRRQRARRLPSSGGSWAAVHLMSSSAVQLALPALALLLQRVTASGI